jgi:hypothetical protein
MCPLTLKLSAGTLEMPALVLYICIFIKYISDRWATNRAPKSHAPVSPPEVNSVWLVCSAHAESIRRTMATTSNNENARKISARCAKTRCVLHAAIANSLDESRLVWLCGARKLPNFGSNTRCCKLCQNSKILLFLAQKSTSNRVQIAKTCAKTPQPFA